MPRTGFFLLARTSLLAGALLLSACGDSELNLEGMKQGAANLGESALNASAGVLDTRSACLLTGQSDAFCACLSQQLGPELSREKLDALTQAVRATVSDVTGVSDAQDASGGDVTREAVMTCAARAAVSGALSEGGN